MKTTNALLVLAIAMAGNLAAESALAGGRTRVVVGVGIGVPFGFGYPYYRYGYGYGYGYGPYPSYYPPYYQPYYTAPVVVQQQPTVYVEQQAPQVQQPAGYWYYCGDSRAYYPYVKECPSGWQRVAPQPGS